MSTTIETVPHREVEASHHITCLVLRSCNSDMSSYNNFIWPVSGDVAAPDWNPAPIRGGGLHGLKWGYGDLGLLNWADDAKWLVVEVVEAEYVDLGMKVKFPRGKVVYCGEYTEAVTIISDAFIARTIADSETDENIQAASGNSSQLAASGNSSRLAASGYSSQLAASGEDSIVCGVGLNSIGSAGTNGCIALVWHDGKRYRIAVGYIGENGIEANTKYCVDRFGKLAEVN